MSNIAVRNVFGIDAFAIPKTQSQLEHTKHEWEKILKTISGLTYKEVYVLVINIPEQPETLHLNCGSFRLNKNIRPNPIEIRKLRTSISEALEAHPGIISFDFVEVQMFNATIDREKHRRKYLSPGRRLKRLKWERTSKL